MPRELIALADRVGLFEMVLRLIFGQDQTVDIVTSGLRIRVLKLISARFDELGGIRYTVVDISPGIAMIVRNGTMILIDGLLVHVDMYVHQCVAADIGAVMTGYIVGFAVIRDAATLADREGCIALYNITYCQVEAVEDIVTVRLLLDT